MKNKIVAGLGALLFAGAVVLTAPAAAQARPVADNPVYCGPGYYVSPITGHCTPLGWKWKSK